jgi:hypothetical protein
VSDTESVAAQEVAPPTEAPSTPEVVEVAPTPEPEVQVDQRAMSHRDRSKALHERIRLGAERQRGADGRFLPQEQAAAPEVAEPEAEEEQVTAAAEVAEPVETDSAAPEVAEPVPDDVTKAPIAPKSITIPLDPSHPLYAQGITELTNVPEHLERHLRTMANASSRKQEVDHARAAQQAAENELAMVKARVEMLQSGELQSAETDPQLQTLLQDVEQAYPDQVDTVKRALEALQQQTVNAKEAEVMAHVQREQVGRQFLNEVSNHSGQQYPVWAKAGELSERMRIAVAQYGDYVDARNTNLASVGEAEQMPTSNEFFTWVDTNYVKDTRVQAQLAKFNQKREKKIGQKHAKKAAAAERAKLAEEEKGRLAAAADRHGTNPPAPPAMRSQGRVIPATPANEEARQNHGTRQRDVRSSIRQRLQQSSM